MTREEKQKAIYVLKKSAPVMPLTQEEFNGYIQAINQVIDWLEQEPVLDKIRIEIKQEIIPRNSDQYDYEAKWQNSGLRMALKVIDKYKLESEDKE